MDGLNPAYSSVDGVLFDKAQSTLIAYPGGLGGSYSVPSTVSGISWYAFSLCAGLTNVTIPSSVTRIEGGAFYSCSGLTGIVIPSSVTSIGDSAFSWCTSLAGIYFQGNAPSAGSYVFDGANNATVYHLPGTTGWDTFSGPAAVLWSPRVQTSDASFGVRTNQFGFNVAWADGMTVVVEACTNPVNPTWVPVRTNTLNGDTLYFSDPQWTDHRSRFYRVRWQ